MTVTIFPGLAIAYAVAPAHSGRLELANRPGGGLRASLMLPKYPQVRAGRKIVTVTNFDANRKHGNP